MKTCNNCKETKYWFQFYTTFEGIYTAVYDICKRCANKMRDEAVTQAQYKINKSKL